MKCLGFDLNFWCLTKNVDQNKVFTPLCIADTLSKAELMNWKDYFHLIKND